MAASTSAFNAAAVAATPPLPLNTAASQDFRPSNTFMAGAVGSGSNGNGAGGPVGGNDLSAFAEAFRAQFAALVQRVDDLESLRQQDAVNIEALQQQVANLEAMLQPEEEYLGEDEMGGLDDGELIGDEGAYVEGDEGVYVEGEDMVVEEGAEGEYAEGEEQVEHEQQGEEGVEYAAEGEENGDEAVLQDPQAAVAVQEDADQAQRDAEMQQAIENALAPNLGAFFQQQQQQNPVSDAANVTSAEALGSLLQNQLSELRSNGLVAADPDSLNLDFKAILQAGGIPDASDLLGSIPGMLPPAPAPVEDEDDQGPNDEDAGLDMEDLDESKPLIDLINRGVKRTADAMDGPGGAVTASPSGTASEFQFNAEQEEAKEDVKRAKRPRKPVLSRVVRATMFEMLGVQAVAVPNKFSGYAPSPNLPEFTTEPQFHPTTNIRLWRWEWNKTIRQSAANAEFARAIAAQIQDERSKGMHTEVPADDWGSVEDCVDAAFTNLRREKDAQTNPDKQRKKEEHRKRNKKRGLKDDKSKRRKKAWADAKAQDGDVARWVRQQLGDNVEEDFEYATALGYMSSEDEYEHESNRTASPAVGPPIPEGANGSTSQQHFPEQTPPLNPPTLIIDMQGNPTPVVVSPPSLLPIGNEIPPAPTTTIVSSAKVFSVHRPAWRSLLLNQLYYVLDSVKPPERAYRRIVGSLRGTDPPDGTKPWMITQGWVYATKEEQ